MSPSRTLSTLAAAAALGLAACGGGDDAPSREEFAQQLDEICADVENELERVERTDPDSPEEAVQAIDEMQQQVDRGIERLADVERPEGEAGETGEQFVEALEREYREQVSPALNDLQEAIRNRDEVQARSAARRLDSLENSESDRLAEELGADECAED